MKAEDEEEDGVLEVGDPFGESSIVIVSCFLFKEKEMKKIGVARILGNMQIQVYSS